MTEVITEDDVLPTPDEVLTALKGSIEKWERIVAGEDVDGGSENCPLCRIFALGMGSCYGCPVAEAVNRDDCQGTPYIEWHIQNPWPKRHRAWRRATKPAHFEAARKELEFLKSLLPKETAT